MTNEEFLYIVRGNPTVFDTPSYRVYINSLPNQLVEILKIYPIGMMLSYSNEDVFVVGIDEVGFLRAATMDDIELDDRGKFKNVSQQILINPTIISAGRLTFHKPSGGH